MDCVVNADVIRKNWIRYWNLLVYFWAPIALLSLGFGLYNQKNRYLLVGGIGATLLISTHILLQLYICRRCAYKKPGVKFLTYLLISSLPNLYFIGVLIVAGIAYLIKAGAEHTLGITEILIFLFLLVPSTLQCLFFYSSVYLLRLNWKIKKLAKLSAT